MYMKNDFFKTSTQPPDMFMCIKPLFSTDITDSCLEPLHIPTLASTVLHSAHTLIQYLSHRCFSSGQSCSRRSECKGKGTINRVLYGCSSCRFCTYYTQTHLSRAKGLMKTLVTFRGFVNFPAITL